MRVYLSGRISGLSFEDANGWRQEAERLFDAHGIGTINPLRGRFYVGESENETAEANEIVMRDLKDVADCDILLVKTEDHTIGTYMEIWEAHRVHRKPVVLVTQNEKIAQHPWIRFAVTKRFTTLQESVDYLAKRWADTDPQYMPERF